VKRAWKRLLTITGAIVIGVLATATPALACHPIITGEATCQANGTYRIDWQVGNGDWGDHWKQKIIEVTPDLGGPVTGFGVGTMININSTVNGVQYVPGNTTEVFLKIKSQWYDSTGTHATNEIQERTGWVTHIPANCTPEPNPTATFRSNCDGTVNAHITNPGRSEATFTVTGTGFTKNVTLASGKETDVTVPSGAGKITVKKGATTVNEFDGWIKPADCAPPTAIGESTCDGFWVKVTNPQGGMPVDATVTYGTQVKKVTVAPGKTEAVELSPSSKTDATVDFSNGWPSATATYAKPADCPGLPQTGSNTAGYIGTGMGMVALGTIVFFLARRRFVQLRRLAQ